MNETKNVSLATWALCLWLLCPPGDGWTAPTANAPGKRPNKAHAASKRRRAKPPQRRLTAAQRKAEFARRFLQLRRRTLSPKGGLLMKYKLVSVADVKRALKYQKPLEALFLQGIPRSKQYDAIQFTPKQGHFLLAVQMWHDPGKQGTTSRKHIWRWRDHAKTYPNARIMGGQITGKPKRGATRSPVGRVSLFAHRGKLYYLQFAASTRPVIISIICHQSACAHRSPMVALGKWIDARLKRTGPK